MKRAAHEKATEALDVFVGEWSLAPSLDPEAGDAMRARTTFEWLSGGHFLV